MTGFTKFCLQAPFPANLFRLSICLCHVLFLKFLPFQLTQPASAPAQFFQFFSVQIFLPVVYCVTEIKAVLHHPLRTLPDPAKAGIRGIIRRSLPWQKIKT